MPRLSALLLLGLATPLAGALSLGAVTPEPTPPSAAQQALKMCDAKDDVPREAARAQLEEALALAEHAVAADERDPKAHMAVFCALAKLTYLDGFSVTSLFSVWRLRREIDRTLELSPDYTDALIAKGGLLLNLPRLLGGDPHEAERVLRRAVELEPERVTPRLYLAEALQETGSRTEAQTQARHALALAQRANRPEQAAAARTLLARLEAERSP
jgi:tetratricopeptide (TPR) repeat protein